MQDVIDQLPLVEGAMPPDSLASLKQYARDIWAGCGQSKVVEDGNREVRECEDFDTKNKVLRQLRMWHVLRARKVLDAHRRSEIGEEAG
eukprot:4203978-Lingulodinium_polyedra.AAC.1